jgi:hypothetical protein
MPLEVSFRGYLKSHYIMINKDVYGEGKVLAQGLRAEDPVLT